MGRGRAPPDRTGGRDRTHRASRTSSRPGNAISKPRAALAPLAPLTPLPDDALVASAEAESALDGSGDQALQEERRGNALVAQSQLEVLPSALGELVHAELVAAQLDLAPGTELLLLRVQAVDLRGDAGGAELLR